MAINTPRVAKIDFVNPSKSVRERTYDANKDIGSRKQSFEGAMSRSEQKFANKQPAQSKINKKSQDVHNKQSLAKPKKQEHKVAEDTAKDAFDKTQKSMDEAVSETGNQQTNGVDNSDKAPNEEPLAIEAEVVDDMQLVDNAIQEGLIEIIAVIEDVKNIIATESTDSPEKLMAEVDVLTIESALKGDLVEGELQLSKETLKQIKDTLNSLKDYATNKESEASPKLDKLSSMLDKLNGEIVATKTTREIPADQMAKEISQKTLKHVATGDKFTADNDSKEVLEARLDQQIFEKATLNVSNQKVETMRSVNRTAVFEQVKEAIGKQTINAGEQSEMIIKLKPEELGKVELKIEVHNDIVIAKFDVASQMVKEIIESNLDDLKSALKDKGFEDLSFDVNVNKDNSNQDQHQSKRQRRRIDLEISPEEGSENYVKSLSAMINDTEFEHLA